MPSKSCNPNIDEEFIRSESCAPVISTSFDHQQEEQQDRDSIDSGIGMEIIDNSAYENVSTPSSLYQQINTKTEPMHRGIVRAKTKGVIFLLTAYFVVSICVNITMPMFYSKGNNNTIVMRNDLPACNDTWMIDYSVLNETYANCPEQYSIGGGIVVSICNHHQFGSIVDIRFFLNSKPTIKGIAIPFYTISRLKSVIQVIVD